MRVICSSHSTPSYMASFNFLLPPHSQWPITPFECKCVLDKVRTLTLSSIIITYIYDRWSYYSAFIGTWFFSFFFLSLKILFAHSGKKQTLALWIKCIDFHDFCFFPWVKKKIHLASQLTLFIINSTTTISFATFIHSFPIYILHK